MGGHRVAQEELDRLTPVLLAESLHGGERVGVVVPDDHRRAGAWTGQHRIPMPYGRPVSTHGLAPPRAVIFDFNGTLSYDEPLLARIFARMFGEVGVDVDEDLYFQEFAGYSDIEIVERVLTHFDRYEPALAARMAERRSELYLEAVTEQSPVLPAAADFVRRVAERVPVAIVTGALRRDVAAVLEVSGLGELFGVLVSAEDVQQGKPHPEGYLTGLRLLNEDAAEPIAAADVLVFEDSPVGLAAAHAAGMRCVVVAGTVPRERVAAADAIVSALDWSIPLVEGWT